MSKDPYRYFRVEARELLEGLGAALLAIESGGGAEPVARVLRLAHTLKGAARVVKLAAIAEHAHALEDLFAPHRADGAPPALVDAALTIVDAIRGAVAAVDAAPAPTVVPASAPAPPLGDELRTQLRVDVGELDALLASVGEVSAQLAVLRREVVVAERLGQRAAALVTELAQAGERAGSGSVRLQAGADAIRFDIVRHANALSTGLTQIAAEFGQLRDGARRLRLAPVDTLFPMLERVVRDAAHALGKRVSFSAAGGEVRLEAPVLVAVGRALAHVLRNAVVHGIESPAGRETAGKPSTGRVALDIERRGRQIIFRCRDDGAGVDVTAVRRVAIARGLVREHEPFTMADAVGALLRGGLTTRDTVDELAGRGVGMDAVREAVEAVRGQTTLTSERGQGATLEITVPVSISALRTLSVEVNGRTAAIPLSAIRRAERAGPRDLSRSGSHWSVVHDGRLIPFAPLAHALDEAPMRDAKAWSVVVLEVGDTWAAVGVDRLHGEEEVVFSELPARAGAHAVVAGTALDEEGDPRLVLDAAALIAVAHAGYAEAPRAEGGRDPVLVIDDSLTTRMLEKTILESAGYRVEVASSAEEGLEKARARRYSLFLVDVEMPGMDGFEFVTVTRADRALRVVPAILITSRDAEADRRRGLDAGASAYVVKAEFDQVKFLGLVEKLTGAA